MRALRSPAISDRAWPDNVRRKLLLSPRTPTSAATPTATLSTTNANLPGADFRSRHAMAAARCQLSARLAIALLALDESFAGADYRRCVLDDHTIFEHDLAIGLACHFRIMRDQHQRCACLAIPIEQQVQHQTAIG